MFEVNFGENYYEVVDDLYVFINYLIVVFKFLDFLVVKDIEDVVIYEIFNCGVNVDVFFY